MNKKHSLLVVSLVFVFVMMSMVSAVKPITSVQTTEGYVLDPTQKDYIMTGADHEFELHVYNESNGYPITSGVTCTIHIYNKNGKYLWEASDNTVSHNFDYSFNVNGTNFTQRGEYEAKFTCNNSVAGLGGGSQLTFLVNDYGEELTDANASMFNHSMIFLMILFILALVGLFMVENYIGKFALYWVCHLLFIVGTFSMWQFNWGYTISYLGMAGFWKILFYVSTIAVVPMIFLSMAWIFYIHAFNEHFQKLVDKGNDTETAFKMANKKSGGWFNGR